MVRILSSKYNNSIRETLKTGPACAEPCDDELFLHEPLVTAIVASTLQRLLVRLPAVVESCPSGCILEGRQIFVAEDGNGSIHVVVYPGTGRGV